MKALAKASTNNVPGLGCQSTFLYKIYILYKNDQIHFYDPGQNVVHLKFLFHD